MQKQVFPLSEKEAKEQGITQSSQANKDAPFPSLLRKLRNDKGISQATLAKEIGVTKSTIGLYETGDNVPDVKTISKMADFYGVSVDFMLCRTSDGKGNADTMAVEKRLGLSPNAQKKLEEFILSSSTQSTNNIITNIANLVICDPYFYNLLDLIDYYAHYKAVPLKKGSDEWLQKLNTVMDNRFEVEDIVRDPSKLLAVRRFLALQCAEKIIDNIAMARVEAIKSTHTNARQTKKEMRP